MTDSPKDSQKKAKERKLARERRAKTSNMAERYDDIVDAPSSAASQVFSDNYASSDNEETNNYLNRLIASDVEDPQSPEVIIPPPERCLCSFVGSFLCSPLGATATAAVAGVAAVAGFILLKK